MAADGKPKGLLRSGIALMIISTILGIGLFVVGLVLLAGVFKDIKDAPKTPYGQSAQYAGDGESASIWGDSVLGSTPTCTVEGPNGSVSVSNTSTASTSSGGSKFESLGTFDTKNGENYSVTCEGSGSDGFVVTNLPISRVALAAALTFGSFAGFFFFFIGVVLLIAGLVARSNWKKRQPGGPGAPGAAFGQPAGAYPPTAGTVPPPPPGFGGQAGSPAAPAAPQAWGAPPAPQGYGTPPAPEQAPPPPGFGGQPGGTPPPPPPA